MQATAYLRTVVLVALLFSAGRIAAAQDTSPPLPGRWQASVTVNGVEIPFDFEIVNTSGALTGSFFNGERRITSTASRVEGNHIAFTFAQYAAALEATVQADGLSGEYRRGARVKYPFRAVPAATKDIRDEGGPPIAGTWIVQAKSSKGETAWRFIARHDRGVTTATILRIDGDTGTLSGRYQDGRYVLSHFSGARPLLLEVIPQQDGTLTLRQNGKTELVAVRDTDARAAGIGVPADPSEHTGVTDPSEPFRFRFRDVNGNEVSSADDRFAGKVVLVNISGSWCPNCHDEAPFLAALYTKYRSRGLEVVTLSFEEEDQLKNPERLRAFIRTYGIEYTVLLAGTPDQLAEKVPQGKNLNAFPTTFILGRDGRVRMVHAGFPSPGSGEFYRRAETDVSREIERLLDGRGSRP